MKFAVFGATGRTGRPLVEQALAQDHEVVALARTPAKLGLDHPALSVVPGDVLDPDPVGRVVAGADAVLLTLGPTKGGPPDLMARAADTVVAAMQNHDVRRVVTETGAGVAMPGDPDGLGPSFMRGVMRLVAGGLLRDSEAHVAALRDSGLDWTAVRAPRLTTGPRTGDYRTGLFAMGPGHSVARADVADFMLRLAVSGEHVGEAPMITSG